MRGMLQLRNTPERDSYIVHMKRLLVDNVDESGNINTDAVMRGMLQLRNTPECDSGLSPVLLGRSLRDSPPAPPLFANRVSVFDETSPVDHHWKDTWRAKQNALRARLAKQVDRLDRNTRKLAPLFIGDSVRIQNQSGNHPNKWDKTGIVIQIGDNDQYTVRVDGSRRLTLRNRCFLKKFQRFAVRAEGEVRSIPPHREPLDTDFLPSLETPTLPDDYMAPQETNTISSANTVCRRSRSPPLQLQWTNYTKSVEPAAPHLTSSTLPLDRTSHHRNRKPAIHPHHTQTHRQYQPKSLTLRSIRFKADQRGSTARLPSLGVTMHGRQAPSSRILNQGPRMRQSLKAHRSSKAFIAPPTTWGGGGVRVKGPLLCTLVLRIVFVTCVN